MTSTPLKIYYYCIIQFIIIYNPCDFVNATALVGENVKFVQNDRFPYVVSLMAFQSPREQLGIHFCSGTLITDKDVLTCAHCIADRDLSSVAIVAGSNDLRQGKKYIPCRWINYNHWAMIKRIPVEFAVNDIAIIKLTESVPVRPATLSNTPGGSIFGIDIKVAGWGQLPSLEMPVFMRTATLRTLSKAECERRLSEAHREHVPVHDRLICSTTTPYTILTFGDSGGPAIYHNEVVAVNTGTCLHQNQPFHPGKINLHVSINYYRRFIEEIKNSN